MSVVFVQFTLYAMYCMKCYMQTTILKPNKRQEPSEVNGQNESQVKPKPKAISQVKPSEAKAKSQKPKAKWARKWEILAPKCMQNTDFSSKMQQIARKAAPGWKTKKKLPTKLVAAQSQWNLPPARFSGESTPEPVLASPQPHPERWQPTRCRIQRMQKIAKDCKMSFNGS